MSSDKRAEIGEKTERLVRMLAAERLGGVPLVLERRKTFYGTDEIGIAEPGGHTVIFAQPT